MTSGTDGDGPNVPVVMFHGDLLSSYIIVERLVLKWSGPSAIDIW
jgi:hypothetical protein